MVVVMRGGGGTMTETQVLVCRWWCGDASDGVEEGNGSERMGGRK